MLNLGKIRVRMACKPDFVRALRPLITIHLGLLLLTGSCCQPGSLGGRTRLAPRDPYLALLLAGLAVPLLLPTRRWAFTPPFHPYPIRGGLFSVALSLGLPQPAINRRHFFLESGLSSHLCSHPAIRMRTGKKYCSASQRASES